MVSRVNTVGIFGVRGYGISVECMLSSGLPVFDVVGLPDAAVREARERVRSALRSCGLEFPLSRITVNLAPADTRKAGSNFDLPILLGLLIATGQLSAVPEDCVFVGELSLDGKLRPVRGCLSMALAALREGKRKIFVPLENGPEAALAAGLEVFAAGHFSEISAHISGQREIPRAEPAIPGREELETPDFSEVRGQSNVKRALEIAAAGGHNILLVGSPGAGKSMLAKRLPGILPDMTMEESVAATEVYSVAGMLSPDRPLLVNRPFRAPHHTISSAGLSGGGSVPRPGEISLAHCGVLFLDELPEFGRDTLEVLRQPIEDGQVTISRVSGALTYPSRFMLVCAMNPCRCGWYGHPSGRCRCPPDTIKRYLGRLSGPLLDRIDMHVEVASVEFDDLSRPAPCESSVEIRLRVNAARGIQLARAGVPNAALETSGIEKRCKLDDQGTELIRGAFDMLGLTARSYDRILRVARTVADLEGAEDIKASHLAEALQFRSSKFGR